MKKTQIVRKHKGLKCDKTKKNQIFTTHIVTQLKNSNCDKMQIAIKLKNKNCDKIPQNSTQFVTI